ncbi:hypothetical protein [Ruegeria sp.]|uniref:hypothetical protein n=1 Tax=Ruegeria sp. TaxID=1879320 RepID=UPI003C7A27E3
MSTVLELVERSDGSIVNASDGDPAVRRVQGYRRYWISADLGQANDFTAVTVTLDEQLPVLNDGVVELGPRELTVVFADRFRGVSYVAVCDYLVRLLNAHPFRGKAQLVIDGTSIGRVCSDVLTEQSVPHVAIQMTGGVDWSRKGRYVNAAKVTIIENTAVLFASGDLKMAHDLPLRSELEADLASFTVQTTAAGNMVIGQDRNTGGHGDLGISLCLGAFAAQYLKPQLTAQGKLTGWY